MVRFMLSRRHVNVGFEWKRSVMNEANDEWMGVAVSVKFVVTSQHVTARRDRSNCRFATEKSTRDLLKGFHQRVLEAILERIWWG